MESDVDRLGRWERTLREYLRIRPDGPLERMADEMLQLWVRGVRAEAEMAPLTEPRPDMPLLQAGPPCP